MTIKVDLLPTEKKRFGIDPVSVVLVVVIIMFTVVFFVYGHSLESKIAEKESEVHKVESDINDLRGKLPGIAKMRTDNEKLSQQINTIRGLKNDPVRYANLLWEIADVLPTNVWVSSINIEPSTQTVTLTGQAIEVGGQKPLEAIAQTMRNFQYSRYFKPPTLSSTSTSKIEGLTAFSFQLEVRYDQDAALKSPDQIPARTIPTGAPNAAPGAPGAVPSSDPSAAPQGAAPPAGEASDVPASGAPGGK